MTKFLCAVSVAFLLASASCGGGGAPGSNPSPSLVGLDLVQYKSASGTSGDLNVNAGGKYNLRLSEPVSAGNMMYAVCYYASGAGSITVTDDHGNTWYPIRTSTGHNSLTMGSWYAPNVAANTRVISFSPANASASWKCDAYVFSGVATANATDGGSANAGTDTTSMSAGSFTPTTSNDLIVNTCFTDGVAGGFHNPTSYTKGASQSNVTWKMGAVNLAWAVATEWGQQTTATAINPAMTQAGAADYNCIANAFKVASGSGGAPTGIHTRGTVEVDTSYAVGNTTPCTGASCTMDLQVAGAGNLGVVQFEGTQVMSISSLTSSNPSCTWNLKSSLVDSGHTVQTFAAENCQLTENTVLHVAETGWGGAESVIFYDVAGANAASYDTQSTATGVNADHNDIAIAITPNNANELIFAQIGVQGGTVWSLTNPSAGMYFTSTTFDGELGNNVPTDRNNGFAVAHNSSATSQTFNWQAGDTTNWDGWTAQAVAFK